MSELILKEESFAVVGACFEVYNELGPGFLEAVYHEALELEFAERGVPFVSKPRLLISFKSHTLATLYEADFLCFEQLVLEIKSAREIDPKHESQIIHYFRATDLQLGILVNFGHYPDLQYKRFARTKTAKPSSS